MPAYSQNEPVSPLSVNLVLDAATSGTIAQSIVAEITASAQLGDSASGKEAIGSQLQVASLLARTYNRDHIVLAVLFLCGTLLNITDQQSLTQQLVQTLLLLHVQFCFLLEVDLALCQLLLVTSLLLMTTLLSRMRSFPLVPPSQTAMDKLLSSLLVETLPQLPSSMMTVGGPATLLPRLHGLGRRVTSCNYLQLLSRQVVSR